MEVAPSKSVRCDTNCVMNTQREYSGIPGSIHKKSDWSVQGTQGSLIVTKCPKSSTNVVQDSERVVSRWTLIIERSLGSSDKTVLCFNPNITKYELRFDGNA